MSSKETTYETITPSVAVSRIHAVWERHHDTCDDMQSRLYRALFCDVASHFPNFAPEDFDYLLRRRAKEGISFYLETLPMMGKAFETSLISGEALELPPGWSLLKGTRLPKFCHQLFIDLMDEKGQPRHTILNQNLYSDTHVRACRYLRQITMMWSKVELFSDVSDEHSDVPQGKLTAKSRKAFEGFIDRATRDVDLGTLPDLARGSLKEAARLLRYVFRTQIPTLNELHDFEKKPWGRQGPGAVAGGEMGREKWDFQQWPGLQGDLFLWREGATIASSLLQSQPPARLCAVPKDFRGPRIICIEPKENQFAQQGLMDILYRHVRAHSLTNRSISFLDTEESRKLCYNDKFATIDMKDASDLISLRLARMLLPRWIFRLVTRYRSRNVAIRDLNRVIPSKCLATMGNATCFPLETLLFWAISLGTMITIRDSFPYRQRRHLNLDLRVFGDDIITPLWAADAVCSVLESSGLSVNKSKTCTYSPVRESCGEWVFMKRPVRIYRFRTISISDHRSWLQWRDQVKDLGEAEMPALHQQVFDEVIHWMCRYPFEYRHNRDLQRFEVLAPQFVQLGRCTELQDYAGLYAWHVRNDRTPFLKGARLRVKMRWQDASIFWMGSTKLLVAADDKLVMDNIRHFSSSR